MVISLYVCQIPDNITKEDLEDAFKEMQGFVELRLKTKTIPNEGIVKMAFVDYDSEDNARNAKDVLQSFKFHSEDKGILIKIAENCQHSRIQKSERNKNLLHRNDRMDSQLNRKRKRSFSQNSQDGIRSRDFRSRDRLRSDIRNDRGLRRNDKNDRYNLNKQKRQFYGEQGMNNMPMYGSNLNNPLSNPNISAELLLALLKTATASNVQGISGINNTQTIPNVQNAPNILGVSGQNTQVNQTNSLLNNPTPSLENQGNTVASSVENPNLNNQTNINSASLQQEKQNSENVVAPNALSSSQPNVISGENQEKNPDSEGNNGEIVGENKENVESEVNQEGDNPPQVPDSSQSQLPNPNPESNVSNSPLPPTSDNLLNKQQAFIRYFETVKNIATKTVYVDGLPNDATEREVAHIFRPFPGFITVRLVTKMKNGYKKLICFADFENSFQSTICIQTLQGYRFDKTDTVGLHFSYGNQKQ